MIALDLLAFEPGTVKFCGRPIVSGPRAVTLPAYDVDGAALYGESVDFVEFWTGTASDFTRVLLRGDAQINVEFTRAQS